ncbi:MAG: hypothetical protein GY796_07380 [Chloroflexi bacterium]|nr:hypothetical protein [Chloroflexota bacterium]
MNIAFYGFRKTPYALLLLTAILLLAACGSGPNLEDPPNIRYGADVCDECSMIINESRYAASYITPAGEVRRFDDLGGMLAYESKHHEDVHIYWVHDFNTEEWIMAKEAAFVLDEDTTTPMGWGLLAFADKADAEHFISENGGTLTVWADLQTAVATGELDPGTLNAHIHKNGEMNHNEMDHDETDQNEMDHNEIDHSNTDG